MNRIVAILLCLSMSAVATARDWEATIRQLEAKPRTAKNSEQIAICCNNLALQHIRSKRWNDAERLLKKAIDFNRQPLYEKHLADLYYEQAFDLFESRSSKRVGGQMHRQAKLLAQRALAYNKKHANAHVLIGKIEYDNQKLAQAKRAWQAAKRIQPRMRGLDELLAKVTREMKVEKTFQKTANSFFDVRYQSSVDAKTAAGLRFAVDTARDVVGRDFGFRPKHKIVLLVYSSESFANLKLGPHWAVGFYDGKIRIPLDDESNLTEAVCTLFHEYTHAVIHDLSQGKCPKWLNEGLAEVQGAKIKPRGTWAVEEGLKRERLIPIRNLSAAFNSSNDFTVAMAYQQSFTLVKFMTETYGYRRMRRLIDETAKDVPLEIALRKTCSVSTEQLESKWKQWVPKMWEK